MAEDRRKTKWSRIKSKTITFISTISIPGIPQIMTIDNFFLKITWILLILLTFAFGFWNIGLAVTDYYQYDKITNIERVRPNNVTFPAITICNYQRYIKDFYINGSFDNYINLTVWTDKNPTIKNFIDWESTHFYFYELETFFDVREHIEYFKIPDHLDCLRFNGVTNKSLGLLIANHTGDYFQIILYNSYNQSLSSKSYITYKIVNRLRVFIADNDWNSFDKLEPYFVEKDSRYDFEIAKEFNEVKLPEPYNQCKQHLSVKSYHRSICIDTCLYREIRNKYNCSFLLSLYSFDGLKQCDNFITFYKKEFLRICNERCPLESCHSEKYNPIIRTYKKEGLNYFRFSFKDLSTLNITQIPKTDLFTFINNIGGGLGLFMGIAFPNLIEFLQFIVEIFLIAFNH